MKVLLLEDDRILCESLKEYLEYEGFDVDIAHSCERLYELTFEQRYALYIFDVNLPDESGFSVLKHLKDAGDITPTIFITALGDIQSITQGFDLGAIDYIKKPFNPEELVVRIKSRFTVVENSTVKYQNLSYEPDSRILTQEGKIVNMGIVQSELFHEFITNIGTLLSQEQLLNLLEHPNANALRVNIAKLKSTLNIKIKNIRSQGYVLEKV